MQDVERGRAFLLNILLALDRTMADTKQVTLAVASNGIAATLLHHGKTIHHRLKAPLKIQKDSILYVKPTDTLAQHIQMTKMIIWDEALMTHIYQFEAFYKTKGYHKITTNIWGKVSDFGRRLDRCCQ